MLEVASWIRAMHPVLGILIAQLCEPSLVLPVV